MASDELFLLLSFTPSPVHLKMMSERWRSDSLFDDHWWEELIATKLPLLKTFEFFFVFVVHTVTNDLEGEGKFRLSLTLALIFHNLWL